MPTSLSTKGAQDIRLPKLLPQLRPADCNFVQTWYVQPGSIVQANDLLVCIETPPADVEIPVPPDLDGSYRVVSLAVLEGEEIHLDEVFITLEPVAP